MQFSIEKILNAKNLANYTNNGKKVPSWVKFKNHIHKMEVIMKKSMFGFYPKNVPFVKISLHNPLDINKVVNILEVRKLNNKIKIIFSFKSWCILLNRFC